MTVTRILIMVPGMPLELNNIKGGAISAISNLLAGFARVPEVSVRVVSYNRDVPEYKSVQYAPNVEITYNPEGFFPFHSLNYFFFGARILKKHLREFDPDIIHYQSGNTFDMTRWGLTTRARVVLTIHGIVREEAKRKKKWRDKLAWKLNAFMQERTFPKNVIHLSNFSVNLFAKKIENNTIIPNAIVDGFFQVPDKPGMSNRLLYIGVIDNNKNIRYLLGQMKVLNDQQKQFELDVLGDTHNADFREEIQTLTRELGLQEQVYFRGWVNQQVVMKYIGAADILTVSSQHESLPMVIAESMAAGKTVVASAVGGIPEMIRNGQDGFLFSLSGTDELAAILANLHNNTQLIQSISEAARASARERYQCESVARKSIAFYEQCL